MNNLLLSVTQNDPFTLAYIIVGILLGIAVLVALIAQIAIIIGYWKGNRINNSLGLTGGEYARKLLDENGMYDVKVKKCGILRTIIFGNHYSISKRTVFLRILTINKTSLTSVAMAAQKVALAKQHKEGNKIMIVRSRLQGLGVFAPSLFIPLVIISLIIDLLVFETILLTAIVIVLAGLFFIFGFIVTLLNIPVEKKAIECAKEWLKESLNEEEVQTISKVYSSYMVEYVMQFIVALLRILQFILKILMKIKSAES